MGEYIKNVKLGTCEDLFYTTFDQLQKSGFSPAEKNPFLKCDSGYRFRFPFPDENFKIGSYSDFNRGVRFEVPDNIGVSLFHSEVFVRIIPEKTNESFASHLDIGTHIPCPYNEAPTTLKFHRWNTAGKVIFDVIQQKYTSVLGSPKLVTAVRCPYCKNVCLLDETEIQSIYDHLKMLCDYSAENAEYLKLHMQIVEFALAGYKTFEPAL
jgi:hypothetical protein